MGRFKVALINPPVKTGEVWVREGRCQQYDIWGAPFPPLSLAYIAGQINELAENIIIDAGAKGLSVEETLGRLGEFNPNLVILSVTTPTIESDLNWFAGSIKESLPQTKIAAIGIHVTALPQETLETYENLDFAIRGEPELTARALVQTMMGADGDYHQVQGLAFKKDGKVFINKSRAFLYCLDDLAFPDWTKVDINDYQLPIVNKPFLLISFTRGCPYSCKFCATQAYNGRKVRKRKIESLLGEIEYDIRLGVRDFLFWTEQFTLDRDYSNKFLDRLISRGLHKKIKWVCNSRVDMVDEALLVKMKKAGCWQIAFGLEFGIDAILQLTNKRTTVEQGNYAIKLAHKVGIVTDGHFIIGYPGETLRTMEATIALALRLPLTFAHFYAATPFPGSQLYQEALDQGALKRLGWDAISQNQPVFEINGLDRASLSNLIRQAYRRFYLRPVIFLRILKIPKGFKEFINLARLFFNFLKFL